MPERDFRDAFNQSKVQRTIQKSPAGPDAGQKSPRLFVDAPLREGARIALERNQSNYLGNVLRLSAGETILVFNGHDG